MSPISSLATGLLCRFNKCRGLIDTQFWNRERANFEARCGIHDILDQMKIRTLEGLLLRNYSEHKFDLALKEWDICGF